MKSIKHLYALLLVVSLGYASTGLGVEDLHITQRNERAKTYDRHENEREKTNKILEHLKTHTILEKTGVSNAYPEGTGKALVYTLHQNNAQALQNIGLSTKGLSGKTFEELKNKVRDALHKKHATELQDMNESQRQQRQNLTKSLEQFDTPAARTTTEEFVTATSPVEKLYRPSETITNPALEKFKKEIAGKTSEEITNELKNKINDINKLQTDTIAKINKLTMNQIEVLAKKNALQKMAPNRPIPSETLLIQKALQGTGEPESPFEQPLNTEGKSIEEIKQELINRINARTQQQDQLFRTAAKEVTKTQDQNLTGSSETTPTTDDNDSDHDFDLADDTTPETIQSSTPQEQESIWKKIKRWLHNNTRFKFSDIAQEQDPQFEQNQKKSRNDIAETKREIRQVQQQIEDKQDERNTLTDDVMKKTEIDKTLSTLEDSLSLKKKVLNEMVKDAQSKGYDITPADRDTWFKHESQQIVEDLIDSPDKNLTAQELDNLVRELNSFSFRSKETRISNIMKIVNENPTSPHAQAIMDKIKEDLNKDNQGKDERLVIEQNNKSEYVGFSINYPELARSFGAQKIGDTTFYKKYGSEGFSINNPNPEAIKNAMIEYITSQGSTATLNSDSSFEAIHSALKTVQKQNPEPATTMLRYFAKI